MTDEETPLELSEEMIADDTTEATEAEVTETEEQPEVTEEPKKGKSAQERIDEIYAQKKEAERDAEYWRAKALEREPVKQPEAEPETSKRPSPDDYEMGAYDPEYLEAVAEWKAEEKVNARLAEHDRQQQLSSQVRELDSNYSQRLEAVKEELPDYDEKVTKSAARGEWPCSELMSLAIRASEVGPKVAYHLATNRDEAVAISRMAPVEQAMAFGRLEARYLHAPTPQPNIATNSPTPPPARTKGGQFAPAGLDDRLSTEAWIAKRNEQVRNRG